MRVHEFISENARAQGMNESKQGVSESSTSGKTSGGYSWSFEQGGEVPWKSGIEANTFIRVNDPGGKTVLGVWADVNGNNMDIEYSEVFDKKLRGGGIYTDFLKGLSKHYNIISDQDHNNAASNIYKKLGADYNHRTDRHTLSRAGQEIDEAELDPTGWGSTPAATDVDYFGTQVTMRPSVFLKLASPLSDSGINSEVARHMQAGGKIAYPVLHIKEPVEWETGDFTKDARVVSHEGRNRMTNWIKLHGDEPILVNIFFRNADRSRFITPDMMKQLRRGVFSEPGRWVIGPLFEI